MPPASMSFGRDLIRPPVEQRKGFNRIFLHFHLIIQYSVSIPMLVGGGTGDYTAYMLGLGTAVRKEGRMRGRDQAGSALWKPLSSFFHKVTKHTVKVTSHLIQRKYLEIRG